MQTIGLKRAAVIPSWGPIDELDPLRASYVMQVHRILWRIGVKAMMRGTLDREAARERGRQEAIERQARYRARHAGMPTIRYRRPADRRSRPQRRHDAVAELVALQAEYRAWFEALPEATRDSATGEALQTILDLDLDELVAIEPPRGFGRD
jgi:hypothetical protein